MSASSLAATADAPTQALNGVLDVRVANERAVRVLRADDQVEALRGAAVYPG